MQPVAERIAPSPARRPSPASPPAFVAVAGAGGFGQFCLEAYRQTDDIAVAAVADPNLAGSAPRTHPDLSITALRARSATTRSCRKPTCSTRPER